ncbi:phytoene desaturase family protein [Nocardioides aequoreus]|uniref:phytoene desaturase family protein n=1 Tax=Nocardioides aequoreus TaxID=397278 RepID=UPI0004C46A6A|nr:FAD-dependent oxidoreductase [Nocardioides aequoreus]
MARVVVVGGGLGGLASAARLAKLGHEVTLLEARDRVGGALGRLTRGDFTWDSGPGHTLLPAVVRDLFRKSGRPLEREVELVQLPLLRRHRFADGTELDLPSGRADQLAAVGAALGDDAAQRWTDYVDAFTDDWEALRKDYVERPWSPELAGDHAAALLRSRLTMAKVLRRRFKDERLRLLAGFGPSLEGHDLRDVPAWVGLWSYLERQLGCWTVPGGLGSLAEVLEQRLATRRVSVELGTRALDVVLRDGRAVGVRTTAGDVDADVVVLAVDPRLLPATAAHVVRTTPAMPPVVCHLGLEGEVPDLPHEVVVHGEALLVLRTTGGQAPEGRHAWTLLGRGRLSEDPVVALARGGIRVRDQVVARVDRSPRDQVAELGQSAYGVQWQGRGTVRQRLGPRTPLPGVYAAGASAAPGAGVPFVGLSAALVAQVVGPAR